MGQMEIGPTAIRRSKGLKALGGTLGALNAILFLFCFIFIFVDGFFLIYLVGLITAVYHIIYGILAILGGVNVEKYRCCVTATLVMGIVGSVVFIVAMFTIDIITWANIDSSCNWRCNSEHYNCSTICDNTAARFLTILLVSFIVGVIDIIASSITCCNMCSCCCCYNGPSNSGIVVSQPSHAYGSVQNQVQTQYPYNYSAINPETGASQPTGANPSMGQNITGQNNQQQNQQINTKPEVSDYQVNHDDHARILSSNM